VDFPLHGVASQLATVRDGTTVEVGPIGREGTTGLPLFLGAAIVPIDTLMQIPGESAHMTGSALRAATEHSILATRLALLCGINSHINGVVGRVQPHPRDRATARALAAHEPRPRARRQFFSTQELLVGVGSITGHRLSGLR
jgi:hypothetical protein